MTLVYCGSVASVHSHKPASPSRVSASCSTPLHMLLFSGPSRRQPTCSEEFTLRISLRSEKSAPICAAASCNRALPTPSRLSEHFPCLSVTWHEKQSTRRRRTRYRHGHTGKDGRALERVHGAEVTYDEHSGRSTRHQRDHQQRKAQEGVSFQCSPQVVPFMVDMSLHGENDAGSALQRRQRRLRQWLRHDRMTVVMALAEATHYASPRRQKPASAWGLLSLLCWNT